MGVRPRGTDRAEVVQVIRTTSLIGEGIEGDPVRYIYQYWYFDGNLLASNDEHPTQIDNRMDSKTIGEALKKIASIQKNEARKNCVFSCT